MNLKSFLLNISYLPWIGRTCSTISGYNCVILSIWQTVSKQLACEKTKKRTNSFLYARLPYPSTILLTTESLDLLIWLPNSYNSCFGSWNEILCSLINKSNDSVKTSSSLYDRFNSNNLNKNTIKIDTKKEVKTTKIR